MLIWSMFYFLFGFVYYFFKDQESLIIFLFVFVFVFFPKALLDPVFPDIAVQRFDFKEVS